MKSGWIKLHRRLLDNPRVTDPEWLAVWVYLLLSATHQPRKMDFDGRIVELRPGQFITGRLAIATATGVHESKVKRILAMMKGDQQIDQQAGVKGSMFTVRNWSKFQDNDQQNDQQLTSYRPASDQRPPTNKNERPEEGKNGKTTTSPPDGAPDGVKGFFEAFVSVFKKQFGEEYSHQRADFVQLNKWRKLHPDITADQFAETCRQVMAAPYSRRAWFTIRGVCPDWSSALASLKTPKGDRHAPTTAADHAAGF